MQAARQTGKEAHQGADGDLGHKFLRSEVEVGDERDRRNSRHGGPLVSASREAERALGH